MKVLMIDAGPRPDSSTAASLEIVAGELVLQAIEVETVYIGQETVSPCRGCGFCADKNRCAIDDIVNTLIEKSETAEAYIVATQSHYSAASGLLTMVLHRFLLAGKHHAHKPAAAVVTCRRSGGMTAFHELNAFFSMKSMPIVSSSYWNILYGTEPEQIRADEEGVRTMKNLARNLAYLLRCKQAGQQCGIMPPILL